MSAPSPMRALRWSIATAGMPMPASHSTPEMPAWWRPMPASFRTTARAPAFAASHAAYMPPCEPHTATLPRALSSSFVTESATRTSFMRPF